MKFRLSWSPVWNLWFADDADSIRTAFQPVDLNGAVCFGVVTGLPLDSIAFQLQHVRLQASSVTFFVVSLTFTAVGPEYHFEMLHEYILPDQVSNWFDAKNYTVVASSLNNEPNNQRQPSWGASVSSVAQKTCFKKSLNFVMVRLYSSQLIPIHMSKNCLPNTC